MDSGGESEDQLEPLWRSPVTSTSNHGSPQRINSAASPLPLRPLTFNLEAVNERDSGKQSSQSSYVFNRTFLHRLDGIEIYSSSLDKKVV